MLILRASHIMKHMISYFAYKYFQLLLYYCNLHDLCLKKRNPLKSNSKKLFMFISFHSKIKLSCHLSMKTKNLISIPATSVGLPSSSKIIIINSSIEVHCLVHLSLSASQGDHHCFPSIHKPYKIQCSQIIYEAFQVQIGWIALEREVGTSLRSACCGCVSA
jgi:hypothetical protein